MKSHVCGIGAAIVVAVAAAAVPARAQEAAGATPGAPLNPYVPPACSGIFTDVACPGGFAVKWIEQFYNDGITSGCSAAPLEYCPDNPVTRAQMAVFVEKAMRGTGPWSPGDLGNSNTGLGAGALLNNSPYAENDTALGYQALYTQSYANGNVGYFASNTAVGREALYLNQPDGGSGNSDGTRNTAVGDEAMYFNSSGYDNTAVGSGTMVNNTTGILNVAVGAVSGYNQQSGSYNTFLGASADSINGTLIDATAIGSYAVVDSSYHVRIGDTQVTQIGGEVAWSNLSDARAKNDIRDLDLGLDFVMQLRPVSFTLKQGNGRTDMGFVAQDVEALLGDGYNVLGIGGDEERTLSLRYTDLIAPMVKAIQEQQAELSAKDSRIADLETRVASEQASLEAQHAEIDELRVQVQKLLAARPERGAGARP